MWGVEGQGSVSASVGGGGFVWSRHEWGFILGLASSLKMTVFSDGFTVDAIYIYFFCFFVFGISQFWIIEEQ